MATRIPWFAPVPLLELVRALSRALDLVSPAVADHHLRVGYVAGRLGAAVGLPEPRRRDLMLAGLMHDVGALSLQSRLDALRFEADGKRHAEAGWRLLRMYPHLDRAGEFVRHHHDSWTEVQAAGVAPELNLLNLADRVDVLIRRGQPVAPQAEAVRRRILRLSGRGFRPEYVEAFQDLADREEFWAHCEAPAAHLDAAAPPLLLAERLSFDETLAFARLFARIIDFRSAYTASHSSGVAEVAAWLGERAGMGPEARELLHMAGYLHDIGKLAVPAEILDKPGCLTGEEWERMRRHAAYSGDVLGEVPGLELVCRWAASHHERLDGGGYPLGLRGPELDLGSRIVAAADVFTAITEDRPYRCGMPAEDARAVLAHVAEKGLDRAVVGLLLDGFDEVDELRRQAQVSVRDSFLTLGRAG
ncbi:MAG: HD-GYP domain-containing protein [Desulfovibrionaceae bacterium]